MDYSNPLLLTARNLGRSLGISRPLQRIIRKLWPREYEAAFDHIMFSNMAPGSIVWDIGANIGVYTRKFADAVGASGRVVAFEPSPTTFLTLKKNTSDLRNITLENIALADFVGVSEFHSAGEDDPTAGMSPQRADAKSLSVQVTRADQFTKDHPELLPHAVKIDVEGFEIDVLLGMSDILGAPELKAIFIEVHFTMLSRRGKGNAPSEIRNLLTKAGFAVYWSDPSHLYALRENAP